MSTVPRPSGASNPSAEAALRDLLDAVHDALNVPLDAFDTMDARDDLIVRRASAARIAIDSFRSYWRDPVRVAEWLRETVAEHAPLPAGTEGGTR